MTTIAERWASFEQRVIPESASPLQRKELRRAFYAGFQWAMVASVEIAQACGDDDARGADMLEALHEECARFMFDLWRGLA